MNRLQSPGQALMYLTMALAVSTFSVYESMIESQITIVSRSQFNQPGENEFVEHEDTSNSTVPTVKSRPPLSKLSKLAEQIARIYQPVLDFRWCIPTEPDTADVEQAKGFVQSHEEKISGLLYAKSHKASSSTCEGINYAIAERLAKRVWNSTHLVCRHFNRHEFAGSKGHARERRGEPSLLWTFVREPAARDLSQIFHFRVGRGNMSATDENIINILRHRTKARQVKYLMPGRTVSPFHPQSVAKDPGTAAKLVGRDIIGYYDFVGLTELMDESLAVMTILWNLNPTDVIVLSSKRSGDRGSYDAGGGKDKKRCTLLKRVETSPAVRNFLTSPAYLDDNADVLLYQAANASLWLTIDSLGRDLVLARANLIRRLKLLAERECRHRAIFPCSSNGTLQLEAASHSCYIQDSGCGHRCVYEAMQKYSRGVVSVPSFQ